MTEFEAPAAMPTRTAPGSVAGEASASGGSLEPDAWGVGPHASEK